VEDDAGGVDQGPDGWIERGIDAVCGVGGEVIERRGRAAGGPPPSLDDLAADAANRIDASLDPPVRPLINATGVVLHTNLGRAPLAPSAIAAIVAVAGEYTNLELDLPSGSRGSRSDHCRALLQSTTGAEDGLVVNNAAGALVLALNALAEGRDVLISRGELIEIGGSFRIPEILAKSGARLREVGTTNRTHLADYRNALNGAAVILTVHRSNFEQRGFVASPEPAELAELADGAGIPYLYDVGSGLLADLSPWGLTSEPRVPAAVEAGAGLVLFSGDKLLGGPQAGCLVGRAALVARCRTNPLARALRADKLTLSALAATLSLYLDPETVTQSVPVLAMLTLSGAELTRRAESLAAALPAEVRPQLIGGESAVGGGSFPGAELPTTLVAIHPGELGADGLALRLRLGDPPVLARVAHDQVLFDPRTLDPDTLPLVAQAVQAALRS